MLQVQRILAALGHFGKRRLTVRHMKVLLAVEQFCLVTKNKSYPTQRHIGGIIGLSPTNFEGEISDLVNLRYLHEVVNTFGDLVITYKLGSMGGRFMQQLLAPKPKRRRTRKDTNAVVSD